MRPKLIVLILPIIFFCVAAPQCPAQVTKTSAAAGKQPAPVDRAQFVRDLTYPPHSVVNADTNFVKTWVLKNAGTTAWRSYRLLRGPSPKQKHFELQGANIIPIPDTPPGREAIVSVSLHTPAMPACAAQEVSFQLQNAQGQPVAGGLLRVSVMVSPGSALNLASASYTTANPFARNNHGGQCTAFAWGAAREHGAEALLGTGLGNAKDWLRNVPAGTDACHGNDCQARSNSIAVWEGDSVNPNGHVAYIERVSGSEATLLEANVGCYLDDDWGGGYEGQSKTRSLVSLKDRGRGVGRLLGYIYLDRAAAVPAAFDNFYGRFRLVISRRDLAGLRNLMAPRFEWAMDGYTTRDQALNNIGQIIGWQKFWQAAGLAAAKPAQTCKPHYCNNRSGYETFSQTPFPLEMLFELGPDGQWHWSAVLGD